MSISTSNRFKFLTSFVSVFLLSIIYFSVNSHAEELNYTEDDVNYTVIQVDFDNIQSSEESLHNDLIQPLAGGYTTIEVDMPIKHQGFIGNKVLNV
ncbi:hypothetical protein ACIQ1D_19895 [Lysinibacillus xylanilyticus]|uniref:hypothetical protein n=1 Tax=Lysinibacillus xylanilyticus TaxID=582475 RepID=UPI003800691F